MADEVEQESPSHVMTPDNLQDSVDAMNSDVMDDVDDLIGFCTECKNPIPDAKYAKSPFFQQGGSVPCCYCGGVTIMVRERFLGETFNDRLDQGRGFGSTKHVG